MLADRVRSPTEILSPEPIHPVPASSVAGSTAKSVQWDMKLQEQSPPPTPLDESGDGNERRNSERDGDRNRDDYDRKGRSRDGDRDRDRDRDRDGHHDSRDRDGRSGGRSRKSAYETEQEREEERNEVLRKLFENGLDHVKVAREGGGSGGLSSVRDEEVMSFFEGFYPDKVRSCYCSGVVTTADLPCSPLFLLSRHSVCVGSTRSYRPLCHIQQI